jgi:excisionase family DNA binding protein
MAGELIEIITIKEVAKLMRVSERTIYRMLKEGRLPCAIKFGGSWRFPKSKIEELLYP